LAPHSCGKIPHPVLTRLRRPPTVLGPQGREFKKVFDGAQENLRAIFGMEMIELPTKDRKILTMEQKRKGGFSLVAVCSAASATNTLAVSCSRQITKPKRGRLQRIRPRLCASGEFPNGRHPHALQSAIPRRGSRLRCALYFHHIHHRNQRRRAERS